MAQAAVQVLGECLRWELGAVWHVDREAGVLRCAHCWCAPEGCPEALASATTQASFGPGEGPLGRVWEAGEAAWLPDVLAAPDFAGTRAAGASAPVHSRVAVPVSSQGEVLGLLELVSRAVRDRDQDTLDLLQWLADQLGTVAARGVPDDRDEEAPPGLEPRPTRRCCASWPAASTGWPGC
jgi:GAF domain-containing protein